MGLLLLCYKAFPSVTEIWGPALWVLAALSMTLGNLTALRQDNIVRMLAYSSIAQGGFILVPFAAVAATSDPGVIQEADSATIVYVIVYAFMNLGAFGVVIAAASRTGTAMIDGWAGMGRYAPRVATLGAIFFSLAGIPPLAGWYAKFAMFLAILRPANPWTTALAVTTAVNAVIALVYCARVAKTMWMDPSPKTPPTPRCAPSPQRFARPSPGRFHLVRDRGRCPALPTRRCLRRRSQRRNRQHLTIQSHEPRDPKRGSSVGDWTIVSTNQRNEVVA